MKHLALCLLAAVLGTGCGEDLLIYRIDFTEPLTNNYGSTAGLAPQGDFVPNDPWASTTRLADDSYPMAVHQDRIVRSDFYWVPRGAGAGLTWEIFGEVSSTGGSIVSQDVGACTLTNPLTRAPITDSDGDEIEIEEEDWEDQTIIVTPDLVTCKANGVPHGALVPHTLDCTSTTNLPCSLNAYRAPLCGDECALTLDSNATYQLAMDGIWNGTSMPRATKQFSTTFLTVDGPRTIRRPLTHDGGQYWTWQTGGPAQGPWDENFSPELFITNVRVIAQSQNLASPEQDVPMRMAAYRFADTSARHVSLCPTPLVPTVDYFDLVRCPALRSYNPTQPVATPNERIAWRFDLPAVPEEHQLFVEFTVSRYTPGGLTAIPARFDLAQAYPDAYRELIEKLRIQNSTKSNLRLTSVQVDKNGWLSVELPEERDIPPGGSTSITVTVNPVEEEGEREETITVTAIDLKTREDLKVKAVVPVQSPGTTFSVTPSDATVPVLMDPWHQSRVFRVENTGQHDLIVQNVGTLGHAGLSHASVALPYRLAPGDHLGFLVTYNPQIGPAGHAAVTVQTDSGSRNVALYCAPSQNVTAPTSP